MNRKLQGYIKDPGRIILWLMEKGLFDKWPDDKYLRLRYRLKMKKKLNLENPLRFSEKLQWLKLNNRKPEYSAMVDKYAAKQYAAKKIGEGYIVKTLGVWDCFDDIDFDTLPDQFVLKCTQDSGGLVICPDKKKLDKEEANRKLSGSLRVNYYLRGREWPYKDVVPKIIAEEYLENDASKGLYDYKVWCFNGRAEYVQFISGRLGNDVYEGFYNRDWVLQDFSYHNKKMHEPIPKPDKLEELLYLSEQLSKDIPFARIDFYILPDNSIRFGEITFYPMGGMERFHPNEMDDSLGKMISLE